MEIEKNQSHKTILKATGVFGFSQVIKILVGVVSSKFVALFLGTIGIGVVGLLQNTVAIITSITGFGINITGVRMIALSHSENKKEQFSKTLVVLKRFSIATGILGVLITILFAKTLSIWTFGSVEHFKWFFVLSINFIFSGLAVNKMVLLQGTRSMKAIAFSTIVYAVLVTVITIPIYYFFRMDGIIAVLVLTTILNYLVNYFFSRKIETIPVQVSIKETIFMGKEMIQLGFLLSINVLFGQITNYLLKFYFNFQNTSESILGLYVVASTVLINYVGLIFNAMSTDFYPRLIVVQKENSQVKEMVNDQIEMALLLITPLIIGLYFLSPFIIPLLYSKDFLGVLLIFKFALLAIIVKSIVWPLAFIILAKDEKKLYFKQELLSDAMNLGFTILAYNYFGLVGIGLGMLLNYTVYGFYVFYVVNKKFHFNFRKDTLLITIKSLILGILGSITVLLIAYPVAFWFLGFISLLSVYFSYVELDKRISFKNFIVKIKNKFKKQ